MDEFILHEKIWHKSFIKSIIFKCIYLFILFDPSLKEKVSIPVPENVVWMKGISSYFETSDCTVCFSLAVNRTFRPSETTITRRTALIFTVLSRLRCGFLKLGHLNSPVCWVLVLRRTDLWRDLVQRRMVKKFDEK